MKDKNRFKRDFTLAALAALLMVPAFGATHNNAHADANSNYFNESTKIMGQEHATQANPYHTPDPDLFLSSNGNHYRLGMGVSQINGQNVSLKDFYNSLTSNNTADGENTNGTNFNDSTQYSPNKLPQTSESNTNNKAKIIGLATTALGLSSLALDIIRKHKRNSAKGINNASLGKNLK